MFSEKIFLCKSVDKPFPKGLEFTELTKEEIEFLKELVKVNLRKYYKEVLRDDPEEIKFEENLLKKLERRVVK